MKRYLILEANSCETPDRKKIGVDEYHLRADISHAFLAVMRLSPVYRNMLRAQSLTVVLLLSAAALAQEAADTYTYEFPYGEFFGKSAIRFDDSIH